MTTMTPIKAQPLTGLAAFDVERCKAAGDLVGAALLGSPHTIGVVASEPIEHFPESLRPVVETIRELAKDGRAVDDASVYMAGRSRGLTADFISRLTNPDISIACCADRIAILREYHQRGELASKLRVALGAAENPAEPLEELRQAVADLDVPFRPRHTWTPSGLSNWQTLAGEPLRTIFRDAIPRNNLSLLVSEGGTGKSFYALQMALGLATGYPCAPYMEADRPGRVLALFGEDAPEIVARRLKAVAECCGIPEAEINSAIEAGRLVVSCQEAKALLTFGRDGVGRRTGDFEALHEYVREHRPDLVVVDPLLRWSGIQDENSNAQFETVSLALLDLAKAAGGAVLALHHVNKRNGGVSDQTGARGGSSLACAARWVAGLRVLTGEEGHRLGIEPDQAWRYIEYGVSKNSYSERGGGSRYMTRGPGGVLLPSDVRNERSKSLAAELARVLEEADVRLTAREIIRGSGDTAKAVREALGTPKTRELEAAVNLAIAQGLVQEHHIAGRGSGRRELIPIVEQTISGESGIESHSTFAKAS